MRIRLRGRLVQRMTVLAAAAIFVCACGAEPSPAPPSVGASVDAASPAPSIDGPSAPAITFRPLTPDERAFAQAFTALADEHNRAVTELLIANPLAEWDLVGVPLAALVATTPNRLAGLPAVPLTQGTVDRLAEAVTASAALLSAIDPHAPRVDQATAYGQALDDWVGHVLPVDLELRGRLGLPPPVSGDLRL